MINFNQILQYSISTVVLLSFSDPCDPRWLIAVYFFCLVTPRGLFGKGKSYENNDNMDNPKETNEEGFSKLFREVAGKVPIPVALFHTSSTNSDLHSIVVSRFMKEVVSLFTKLAVDIQCRELLKVSMATSCGVSSVGKILHNSISLRTNISKMCTLEKRANLQTCNTTAVAKVFVHQMGKLFASLPWPFKCNIVNLVALAYRVQNIGQTGKHQLRITVQDTEVALEKIFPFIHIDQKCSKARQDVVLPSVSLVNLTVQLKSGTVKDSWLKNLETKGPQIYSIYLKYEDTSNGDRPLLSPSVKKTLPADVPLSQIYITKVSKGTQRFFIVFGLKIKKKGQFREMKSSHKIVKSLRNAKSAELDAVLNATVLRINLKKEEAESNSSTNYATWTAKDLQKARSLFPRNLTAYYKEVDRIERCFIMFWISSSLRRSPTVMEMFFNALRFVTRRHSCYHTARIGRGNQTVAVKPERLHPTEPPETPRPTSTDPSAGSSQQSTPHTRNNQNKKTLEEVSGSESEVSSLELALFILLGLLCVATLAFTINYAIFAFKKSPTRANGHLPQNPESERKLCVHVTSKHHNMANKEPRPFAFKRDPSTRSDIEKPYTGHSTKCLAPALDTGTREDSQKDSGYTHSREPTSSCCMSITKECTHSQTQPCNGNSKISEHSTELGSEAVTSGMCSWHSKASNTRDSLHIPSVCSDSSKIQSPCSDSEGWQHRSPTIEAQEKETCNQFDTTEGTYETLHVMFDCPGIKEVQV